MKTAFAFVVVSSAAAAVADFVASFEEKIQLPASFLASVGSMPSSSPQIEKQFSLPAIPRDFPLVQSQ